MSNVVSISPSPTLPAIAAETQSSLPSTPPLPPQHSPSSSTAPAPSSSSSPTTQTTSPPIPIIAGVVAGVIVIMVVLALWLFLRKRRQNHSKTSPSISPKGRDLEQQLGLHHLDNDKEVSSETAPRRSTHERRTSTHTLRRSEHHHTTVQPSIPTSSTTQESIPPRNSSNANHSNKAPSLRSVYSNDHRSSPIEKKKHRRQPSAQSISKPPLSSLPPPPPTPTHPSMTFTTHDTPSTSRTTSTETKRKSVVPLAMQNRPTDCHIDMVDMDVETLMPMIISEEIQPPSENTPVLLSLQPQQQKNKQQHPNQQDLQQCVTSRRQDRVTPSPTPNPIISSIPIMPTPTPRRPSLATRKSTDSYMSSRISLSHLPPPPPPSVPPPAIPLTYPGSLSETHNGRVSTESSARANIYATCPNAAANSRGRRPRASTESSSSRRSISLDSTGHWDDHPDLSARAKPSNNPSGPVGPHTSKKIIMPPSAPPPPPSPGAPPSSMAKMQSSQPSQIPVHARRKGHQRTPSHVLSTGFYALPDRSPLSPLSPPLSPLTVQIPRNTHSSSSALRSTTAQPFPHHAPTNVLNLNRPDSPTAGSSNPSPTTPTSSKVKAHTQAQNRRVRSKSISQAETHRIMIPSSSATAALGGGPLSPPPPMISRFMPPLPPMPAVSSRLSDHLPPPPASHSHLVHVRRPSLAHYQVQQQVMSNSWDGASRPSTATPTATASSSKGDYDEEDQEERERELQRRSTSLDSWMHRSSPTSPTSPTTNASGSQVGGGINAEDDAVERYSIISSDRDLDVQTIISDALAIAAAKSAAIDAARQSGWYKHQKQYQRFSQHQQLPYNHQASRPWTPSGEHDGGYLSTGPTTSTVSSRSESPYYSTFSTNTPSPSH